MSPPNVRRRSRLHRSLARGFGLPWPSARLGTRVLGAPATLALLAALAAASTAAVEEPSQAAEQARLCEKLDDEAGIAACRAALALGLEADRRGPVREILARHLTDLERWSELAELYREDVRLSPEDAGAWLKLGSTLLFALNQRAEALAALEEAARLDPKGAEIRLTLAIALHSLGRYQEATAAFDEALQLDPTVLEGRPAARAVREAALRGEPWP
jgi:tetratricopeptide (TPR) repeat protein